MNTLKTTLILSALALCSHQAQAAKLKVPKDYPTIQDAIDAAGAGDLIVVKPGLYEEELDIINHTDLSIRGQGQVIVRGDGAGTTVMVSNSPGTVLENLQVENVGSNGIVFSFSDGSQALGCKVMDAGSRGIWFVNGSEGLIRGCSVRDTGAEGIRVSSSSGCNVVDNSILRAGDAGILVLDGYHSVTGNRVREAATYGIRLGDDGIDAEFCLALGNRIADSGNDGILVNAGTDSCTLMENVIRGAQDDGINLMHNSAFHLVDDNLVKQSLSDGLAVSSDSSTLSRNRVKKAGGRGLLIGVLADDDLFFKNVSKKSTLDGIRVSGSPHTFIENKATQSGGFDLNDSAAPGLNSYVDNQFETVN